MTRPIHAADSPLRARKSLYPAPFAERMSGREKRVLGDLFGLSNFGVNLTTLAPGAVSALHHAHTTQDEFVFVLTGRLILCSGDERHALSSGMCAGFAKGTGAHHLVNESEEPATYLEIGDRSPGDLVTYPDDDLAATYRDGGWIFTRKDGTAY